MALERPSKGQYKLYIQILLYIDYWCVLTFRRNAFAIRPRLIDCPPGLCVRGAPAPPAQPARHECALRPVCLARCYTPIYERASSIHRF